MDTGSDNDFRTSAASTRRDAQDILKRYRAERAARRSQTKGGRSQDQQVAPAEQLSPAPIATEERDHSYDASPELLSQLSADGTAEAEQNTEAAADETAEVSTSSEPAQPVVAEESSPEQPSDDGAKEALTAELNAAKARILALEEQLASPASEAPAPTPDEPSDISPTEAPAGASLSTQHPSAHFGGSLQALPCIGGGMIWHLTNAGISSLHDLAHADSTQLKQRLGKVGTLGKIDEWIQLAQQQCAAENTAPTHH